MKTAVILLDGAARPPCDALAGRTALQAARIPSLDALAAAGASGVIRLHPKKLLQNRSQLAASILWGKSGLSVPACASLAVLAREGESVDHEMSYALSWICIEEGQVAGFPRVASPFIDELLEYLKEGSEQFGYRLTVDKLDGSIWITFSELAGGPVFPLPEKILGQAAFSRPDRSAGAGRIASFQRWLHQLLDGHPINLRRAEAAADSPDPRDRLPVNGVWLFEGGSRPPSPESALRSTTVLMTDSAWGVGLGRWGKSAVIPVSKGLTDKKYPAYAWDHVAWLKQMISHDFLAVFVENAPVFGQYEGPLESVRRLEALDREVFKPFLEAMQRIKPCRIWVLAVPAPGSISDRSTAWQIPFCCVGEGISPDIVTAYDETACQQGRGGRLNEKEFLKLLNKERT